MAAPPPASRAYQAALTVRSPLRSVLARGWPGRPDRGLSPTVPSSSFTSCVLDCRGRALALGGEVAIMGILNVTPDSFSDGGRFADTRAAVERGVQMAAEGAALIDVGGQSTRPGFAEISAEEEINRVVPVVTELVRRVSTPVSVDTYKADVARAALEAGAHLLNDVHGLQGDPEFTQVAAQFRCPVVVMHQERAFAQAPGDTIEKLAAFFERSIAAAAAAGIPRERLVIDPGIGFLKTQTQNLEIVGRLQELRALGLPLLLGASRKSFIGNVLTLPAPDRLEGTLATTALAAWTGVEIIRVHDVAANVRVAKMIAAIRAALPNS